MKKSWLEFYALVVCFATLICLVVTSAIIINSLIGVVNPEFSMSSYEYKKFSTNEAYLEAKSNDYYRDQCYAEKTNHCKETNPYTRMAEIDATKLRQKDKNLAIDMERRDRLQALIHAGIALLIAALVLFIHIRIVRKERKNCVNCVQSV